MIYIIMINYNFIIYFHNHAGPLPGFFTSDTEFGTGVKEPGQDIATDEMFVCLTDLKARNVKTLTMDCVPKDGSLNVKWFRNGVDITASLEDPNSYTFNVENGVNITCEIMNECGTNTYPAIFSDSKYFYKYCVCLCMHALSCMCGRVFVIIRSFILLLCTM